MNTARTCPVCNVVYQVDSRRLKYGRQTTCSPVCSRTLRAANLKRSVSLTCAFCGKTFLRIPSHVKSKHKAVYCSRECHYGGRSVGLTPRVVTVPYIMVAVWDRKAAIRKAWETRRRLGTHRCSDTTKERLRHATSQRIASRMQHGRCISSIEEIVAKELTRLAVPFQRQVGIRSKTTGRYVACADFVLDGRIVLEVNGTFWHADPRSYPNGPTYPAQLRTATAYAKKKEALVVLGIPLVEIWETDLTDNATLAVAQALQKAGMPV